MSEQPKPEQDLTAEQASAQEPIVQFYREWRKAHPVQASDDILAFAEAFAARKLAEQSRLEPWRKSTAELNEGVLKRMVEQAAEIDKLRNKSIWNRQGNAAVTGAHRAETSAELPMTAEQFLKTTLHLPYLDDAGPDAIQEAIWLAETFAVRKLRERDADVHQLLDKLEELHQKYDGIKLQFLAAERERDEALALLEPLMEYLDHKSIKANAPSVITDAEALLARHRKEAK